MLDMICPNCGRAGTVPMGKEHSRLVCKKCHGVFHLTADGKTHLGEPPGAVIVLNPSSREASLRGDNRSYRYFSVDEFTPFQKGLFGVLLALGLVAVFSMVLAEKSESLEVRARQAVNALVDSDMRKLKQFAKPGSEDYLRQWGEAVTPQIEEMKAASLTSSVNSMVLVTHEDLASGFGQVSFYLSPAGLQSRTHAKADSPKPSKVTEYVVSWYREPSGRWVMDGQSTLQHVVSR